MTENNLACDICGKTGTYLEDLREQYQTATIKQVCPGCEAILTKELERLRKIYSRQQALFMRAKVCGMRRKLK